MKSKKQLFKDLQKLDPFEFANVGLKHKRIANETYGKDSMIYVSWDSFQQRREGELKLEQLGHKIHYDYAQGSSRSEIQVTYFKGWHWDE